MRTKFFKWMLVFGAAGLLVPAELLIRYAVFHATITTVEWWLWPSAIFTMALEGRSTRTDIASVWALAAGVNVLLYAVVGLATWPLRYIVIRRSKASDATASGFPAK